MENLYKPNVDTSTVDDLISGTLVTAKVVSVTVTGTGIVKRGTLLWSEDGETFEAYDPADEDMDIQCVLLQDVDADDSDSNVGATAFGGEFNQNKIEDVMGEDISPVAIHKARLGARIFIAPMNPAPEEF